MKRFCASVTVVAMALLDLKVSAVTLTRGEHRLILDRAPNNCQLDPASAVVAVMVK